MDEIADVPMPAERDSDAAVQGDATTEATSSGAVARRPQDELQHARDRALVEQAVNGNLEAFNELVRLYQDYLFSLVVRVVA